MFSSPWQRALVALVGGTLTAFALPPWGWWPLAFVGTAAVAVATDVSAPWERLRNGFAFGLPWMLIGMGWMWFLTPPGYVLACVIFALFHGIAAAATPAGRNGTWSGPALHTVAEWLRWNAPFGGVPLASPALAMSASPFRSIAHLGGEIALTWFVFQVGWLVAAVVKRNAARKVPGADTDPPTQTSSIGVIGAGVALGLFSVVAAIVPNGRDVGEPLRIAVVQGGGRQGTTALDVPAREVFEVHLAATKEIATPASTDQLGLVVWPENGVAVWREPFEGSEYHTLIAEQAQRLGVPILVGVTEDIEFSSHPTTDDSFVNAQIVVNPDGTLGDRYEKVHIVPFGEYVPLRGVLTALGVDLTLIGRDATRGQDPAQLTFSAAGKPTTVGVMISWEVFFSARGRAANQGGAELLINPTNGSSYTGTILQTQQIAASKLRATETGLWVVQSSPTGFSAFVSPDGQVIDRTSITESKVITADVPRRSSAGGLPVPTWLIGAAAVLIGAASRRLPQRDERT